ncbi:MAG: DJ-1/PfpI family protein [Thermodesulfobacteriota bacterium]|jgi:putative intracellular protease/amidase
MKRKAKKMKRLSFMVAILLSLVMICGIADAQSISQVLLIPREGQSGNLDAMLKKEVGVMTDMLQKAGFKVVVANVSGQPIEGILNKLKPDLKLSEVKVDNYAGFILPCMAVGMFPGPPVSPAAVSIVKQAIAKGKPVAAQTGSVYILAEAGVLKGKRYAFVDDPLNQPPPYKDSRFEGAIYSGSRIVQDGNIITSGVCPSVEGWMGMPDCTPELTRAFIAKLGRRK